MKIKVRRTVVIDEDVSDSVKRFNLAMNELSGVLVNRTTEIEALKLALITRSHLLLEGLHGIAKSMLAEEAFSRITGAKFYTKQLMKGVQPDEVFGPMKSKKYREEAIWEHNIEGMLPDAHFAYLDELYRASENLLPSMLGVLNERRWMNGTVEVKCPLMTAIATTNYIPTDPELLAFHDRWLLRVKVLPLDKPVHRITMLQATYAKNKAEAPKRTVSLNDIQRINQALSFIEPDDDSLELYEETVAQFARKTNSYVSDRRLNQALQLARAAVILNKPDKRELEATDLFPVIYGIAKMNEDSEVGTFTDCCNEVIKRAAKYSKERATVTELEEYAETIADVLTRSMKTADLKECAQEIETSIQGIGNMDPSDRIVDPKNQERLNAVLASLNESFRQCQEKLNKLTTK
jgi:MoxR-like ATPase